MSSTAAATLELLRLDLLDDHPLNPRLSFRQDVISAIAADLTDGYPKEHAIKVRPTGNRFEILSGHHRRRAAAEAGLESIWAWIVEMDDEAASMALLLSNRQGELSPLEIGIHALRTVPLDRGGRGRRGGLAQYARQLGIDKAQVSRMRQAAEVAQTVELPQRFLAKATHLSEIRAAPPDLWSDLAEAMLAREWSVSDTKERVQKLSEFDIPDQWATVFLDPAAIGRHYLDTNQPSPVTVGRLGQAATAAENALRALGGDDAAVGRLYTWLQDNAGADAWDPRKILAHQKTLELELGRARAELHNRWNLGDWREHVGALTDGSVALVLSDSPYGMGYQSRYRRELHRPIANDNPDAALRELRDALDALHPKLATDAHVLCFCRWKEEPAFREVITSVGLELRGSLIWVKSATGMGDLEGSFAPQHERILHAVKGSPKLFERASDVVQCPRASTARHPAEKPIEVLQTFIRATTVEGELVVDPFGGVGSTLVAARDLGRNFWGCELDEQYHRIGRERLGIDPDGPPTNGHREARP